MDNRSVLKTVYVETLLRHVQCCNYFVFDRKLYGKLPKPLPSKTN